MAGRWNPWRELRARPHIRLKWTLLHGDRGVWELHHGGLVTIHLDPRLSQRERRCVLAHELVHDERQLGYEPGTPQGLVDIEERTIWREVARRLVPPDELAAFVARSAPLPLEVWEIADEFDVDRHVARLACALIG
jgi:hypothetical protein